MGEVQDIRRAVDSDEPFVQFLRQLAISRQLYEVTLCGQRHREVELLKLLKRLGSKRSARSLSRRDLAEAIVALNAIERTQDSAEVEIEVTIKELAVLRTAVAHELRLVRHIPTFAREQAILSLTTAFEAYFSDILRHVFSTQPKALKSSRKTLKDEELVEAVANGRALDVLRESRVRDIMYGSLDSWLEYLRDALSLEVRPDPVLHELFLVRNCLVHNGGRASKELSEACPIRRYSLGKQLRPSERDWKRFFRHTDAAARGIEEKVSGKFGVPQRVHTQ